MTVTLWNPAFEVEQLNRMFGSLFNGEPQAAAWAPNVDIFQNGSDVVVQAELPGLKREGIHVTFEENVLTVEGDRQLETGVSREQYNRRERPYGAFRRSLTLPSSLDSARAQASYQDGVLTITLPQREDAKPREIQVKG
jgi:HSP20 family protein